ncbi:MAG TPA: heme exporter protein CcmB [Myxococcaceae bacterium]|nr:heme exporter protein CcmB [Myxococcaceae bacterium]
MSASTRIPGLLRATWLLVRKDLLLEWRTRARANALFFFALATLLLFSFALGPDTTILRRAAGGTLWLAILLASVLALGESFRVEQENAALDGLRLAPADPQALFLAKALANGMLLLLLGVAILPVLGALAGLTLAPRIVMTLPVLTFPLSGLGAMALVLVLGCLAIAAPGTIYAAIASNARARDVLLPLLLFPLLIPALVASAKATSLALEGDPMLQFGSWLGLLASFDLIYWSLGFALFPLVVED